MPAISLLTGACVPAYAKFPEQGDYWCNASRIVHNVTIADNVLQHGGKIWPEATGILMQVAHDSELTHNDIHAYYCTIAMLSRFVALSPSR